MSIQINVNISDERLLQDSKRRAAANQQALDDRTQTAKNQQAAEQAAQQATPEERPSAVPDLRLERRPSAQRKRDQLQLDPIILRSALGPGSTSDFRTRIYYVVSGSEGVIYTINPYNEAGLPEKSTSLVPGLRDSMLEAARNWINGGEILNRPVTVIGTLADYNEFFTALPTSGAASTTTFVGDGIKADRARYEDVLASAYIVNDTLQLVFYRSFTDAYEATFTATYNASVGGTPTPRLFEVKSNEIPRAAVNCLTVTLNLNTKAVTKSSFTFYTFETLRVSKSRRYVTGAFNSGGETRVAGVYGYRNWREYEENIYTTELLNFLSSSFPSGILPFDALPVFIGNYQENYKHVYSDNPAEPRTVAGPLGGSFGGNAPTITASFLNPSTNGLTSATYHDVFSFLPYTNPMYATNVTSISDTFNFISVPRWGSYDTRSGNRIVYGGQSAQPPDFSLLELEKVPPPLNAQSLKKYSYPWPQSFVAYNEGTAKTTPAQGLVKLNALSLTDQELVLNAPAPAFVTSTKDSTAPSLPGAVRKYIVNGIHIEQGRLSSLPGFPLPNRGFNTTVSGGTATAQGTYIVPKVVYHIVQK
jgi:hypothetical protein